MKKNNTIDNEKDNGLNRVDFVVLYDVKDANPNGDPDGDNMPRIDPETGHGIVTDACLKRKIRNYVQITHPDDETHQIYVTDGAVLNRKHEEAFESLGLKKNDDKQTKSNSLKACQWMCNRYYDIRTFGAVMSTGDFKCGQVLGPVQISFSRSVSPITVCRHAVTRCAVTNEKDESKEHTFGEKFTTPYGLYVATGSVNPFFADKTGFSEADLELLFESILNMFEFDASAARPSGSMVVRKLIVFKHGLKLGSVPSYKLFESVSVKLKDGVEYPRSINDYEISIPEEIDGVEIQQLR